jgi:hypothetical protein
MMLCALVPVTGQAVLAEGTLAVEGVPGFVRNRIPALTGSYTLGPLAGIRVYAVSEPLLFDPAVWTERKAGSYRARYTSNRTEGQVWAVERSVPMREELNDHSRWFFLVRCAAGIPEPVCISFIGAFIPRTEFFFSSARRLQDLSFPAVLDVRVPD